MKNELLNINKNISDLIKEFTSWIIFLCITGVISLAFETSAHAAKCDPEVNCEECSSKGERMKCKFDAFIIEGDKLTDNLEQSPVITEAHREGLKKAKDRFSREKGRLKSEDFHLMAKKKDVNCQLIENTGNGDGICDPKLGETCVEVLDDGIGDDDGICEPVEHPMKGKNREICAQICDEEAILEEESNVDEGLASEIESTYEGMTDHLREVNETSPEAMTLSANFGTEALNTDPCSFNPQNERTSYEDYKKARWAVMGSRSGADVMERFCDQTFTSLFATWTLGAACVAAETAVVGVNHWFEIIDIKETELDIKSIDATLACASQATSTSQETAAQITVVRNKINDLKANQAIILDLLSTPPGQRPKFP